MSRKVSATVKKKVSLACLVVAGALASACTKTAFWGMKPPVRSPSGVSPRETDGPGNPPASPVPPPVTIVDPPGPSPTPTSTVVPPQGTPVEVELKVLTLKPDAWWKSCLSAGFVGGSTDKLTLIGCNKDNDVQTGTTKTLTGYSGKCNTLRFVVQIYRNQGSECETNLARDPKAVCMGPYSAKEDFTRSTQVASGSTFFKFYDARKQNPLDSLILLSSDLKARIDADEKSAPAFSQNSANRWIRAFFEDQPEESIASTRADASRAEALGVDYNDFIFDVQAKNLKIAVEGSPITCGNQ